MVRASVLVRLVCMLDLRWVFVVVVVQLPLYVVLS